MYLLVKRIFDFSVSLILIVLLSPLFIILILALIIFNKADIFYFQKRIGLQRKTFNIIKFSSMLRDSVNMAGGAVTVRNDPRVTKIGKILRITKLNELPQLFNVLIGDMSFVGPRPIMEQGYSMYSEEAKTALFETKPGITGISSVVFRDEEILATNCGMDPKSFFIKYVLPYKSRLELWYFNNKSFRIDFMLLILTAIKIFFPGSKIEFKIFPTLPRDKYFI